MTKEEIKNELIRKVENLLRLNENKMRRAEGLDKLNAWQEKFDKTPDFSKLIVDKLKEVLVENKIDFKDENDKNDFLEYIKPTVKELVVKFMKN